MSEIFTRWKIGLATSSKAALGRLAAVVGATEIGQNTWDELEALLLQADIGMETTELVLKQLREAYQKEGMTKSSQLQQKLEELLLSNLVIPPVMSFPNKPHIILLVGVNGSGKTTTLAKLGYKMEKEGQRVLMIGADTFRAAAVDQLQVWAEKLGLTVFAGQMGSDPGAVVFDGIKSAMSRGYDIVLVDTAGRLHTRFNLMEELKKIYRVAGKALPGAPHSVWLVLDATTGQNALIQARAFKEAVDVTGVILAKLDSSARGGMAFAIQKQLGLPILFAGLGEKPEDLVYFDPKAFVTALLAV